MNPLDIINKRRQLFKFVTPEEVKISTGLSANITDDGLNIPIITATDMKIKPIIGDYLYNNLKTLYIAANYDDSLLPDSLTSTDGIDYRELYNQIYQPLCWWSYIESLLTLSVKIEEKGIQYNTSDYSTNGEISAYNQVHNRQRKVAESYTEKLICYVKETFKDNATVSKEVGAEGTYASGIYFYKPTKRPCKYC